MKVPKKNQTVTVIPTHIVCANKIYVQVFDQNSDEFDDMQFEELQKIKLKDHKNPGENIIVFIIFAICAKYLKYFL